ncbi:hypothetical protein, partial [uncultured Muribaculum sp.]|uniref:hypothetical protein n=1 Tax=uncultured Muribaculum sp. TaxID=1918613 RepID=UPI002621184C
MNFLRYILSYFRREAATKSDVEPSAARTGATPLFVYGGQTAMSIATVFRCVKLLSESVANLPLQYVKR